MDYWANPHHYQQPPPPPPCDPALYNQYNAPANQRPYEQYQHFPPQTSAAQPNFSQFHHEFAPSHPPQASVAQPHFRQFHNESTPTHPPQTSFDQPQFHHESAPDHPPQSSVSQPQIPHFHHEFPPPHLPQSSVVQPQFPQFHHEFAPIHPPQTSVSQPQFPQFHHELAPAHPPQSSVSQLQFPQFHHEPAPNHPPQTSASQPQFLQFHHESAPTHPPHPCVAQPQFPQFHHEFPPTYLPQASVAQPQFPQFHNESAPPHPPLTSVAQPPFPRFHHEPAPFHPPHPSVAQPQFPQLHNESAPPHPPLASVAQPQYPQFHHEPAPSHPPQPSVSQLQFLQCQQELAPTQPPLAPPHLQNQQLRPQVQSAYINERWLVRTFGGGGEGLVGHASRDDGPAPTHGMGSGPGSIRPSPPHSAAPAAQNSSTVTASPTVSASASSQVSAAPATQSSAIASKKGSATSVSTSTTSKVRAAPVWPPQSRAWCEVCELDCGHLNSLRIHKDGKRHKKKLLLLEQPQQVNKIVTRKQSVQTNPNSGSKSFRADKVEDLKGKQLQQEVLPSLDVTDGQPKEPEQRKEMVNNSSASTVSSAGAKRKSRDQIELEGRDSKFNKKGQELQFEYKKTNQEPREPVEPPKTKVKERIPCKVCNIGCSSQYDMEQHIRGKKHIANLKGDQGLHGETGFQAQTPHLSNCSSASLSDNPQLQQGVTTQLQQGDATELKQVDAAHLVKVDAARVKQGYAAQLKHVDAAHLELVDAAQLKHVDADHLKLVDAALVEQGDAAQLKQVDAARLEQGDTAQLELGNVAQLEQVDAEPQVVLDQRMTYVLSRAKTPEQTLQRKDTVKNSLASSASSAGFKRKSRDQIEPEESGSEGNGKKRAHQSEDKKTNQEPRKPKETSKVKGKFFCKACNIGTQSNFKIHLRVKKHIENVKKLRGDRGLHGHTGLQAQTPHQSNCSSASLSDYPQVQQGNAAQPETPEQIASPDSMLASVRALISSTDAQTPFANIDQIQGSLATIEVGSRNLVPGESESQQLSVAVNNEVPETAATDTRVENDELECFLNNSITIPLGSSAWEVAARLRKRLSDLESEAASLDRVINFFIGGTNNRTENDERESKERDLCVPHRNLVTTSSERSAIKVEVLNSAILKKCVSELEIEPMTSNYVEEEMEKDPEEDPEEDPVEDSDEDPEEEPEEDP